MPFEGAASEFLEKRIEAEAELGRRSFYDFYKLAWPTLDSEPYVDGSHIRVITYHLQLAARREIQQMVICIPPRHSKSLLCSVAFPAWIWTWWPSAKFITVSYDLKLATRDSAATRRLIESPWYQARWPNVRLLPDQNQKMWYLTTAGGVRYVGSPASGVTGHGADFIINDDPHDYQKGENEKLRERAWTFQFETLPSRFNSPERGVSLVIQQRVAENDVAGECIKRGYYTVVLPARYEHDHPQRSLFDWRTKEGEPLWPGKFTERVLRGLWATIKSAFAIASQQQQRPTAREGGLFKREWFEIVDTLPTGLTWVRSWDFAGTKKSMKADPDHTVGCKMGFDPKTKIIYIANVVRFQEDPGGVETRIKNIAVQDGTSCKIFLPQDPAQAGKAQINHYVTSVLQGYPVVWATMQEGKLDRADPLSAQAKAGNVKLYRAEWNEPFLEELNSFPRGAHDDQVDAAATGYTVLSSGSTGMLDFMRQQADLLREAQKGQGGPSLR